MIPWGSNNPHPTMSQQQQPYFRHHCPDCSHLGSADINGRKLDFYHCGKTYCDKGTILWRESDEESGGSSPEEDAADSAASEKAERRTEGRKAKKEDKKPAAPGRLLLQDKKAAPKPR